MMNTLDASILEGVDYSDADFISELRSKTQNILRHEFADNYQKQQIKIDKDGLNIACPYCRDSMKSSSRKRGHLLINGRYTGYYKCFNCNTFVPITKFMNDFKESMSLSGIKYVSEHKHDISTFSTNSSNITADVFCKSLAVQYGIDRNYFRDMFNLSDINTSYRGINGYTYLTNRLQYKFNNFLYDPKLNCILILNLVDNKIIGLQLRFLNPNVPKEKRYKTYNLQRIYKTFLKNDSIVIPDEVNTMSMLYNIYGVNVYTPIIVTEGPLDAMLLPNAIATAGANKKIAVELPFYYMYDADGTGNKHAIEKLREHQKVFMWGKFKHDFKLPKRDKWDTNDAVMYIKKTYGDVNIDWLKYFTNNQLDMIYLDDLSMSI